MRKVSEETQAFHSEFPLGPMEDSLNNNIVYNFKYQILKFMYHTQPPKAGGPSWIYSLNDSIIIWVHLFFVNLTFFILSLSIINYLLFTGQVIYWSKSTGAVDEM